MIPLHVLAAGVDLPHLRLAPRAVPRIASENRYMSDRFMGKG